MIINLKIYDDLLQNDPRRFYPDYFPVIVNEPLNINFIVVESPEEIKKGLISKISFEAGDLIAQCVGIVINFQTLHSLQFKEGIYYHDPFFAGFLLHSCEPNSKLCMENFTLKAIKKIKCFDLITIDYECTEKKLYQSFDCFCGASSCRGKIIGYGEGKNIKQ